MLQDLRYAVRMLHKNPGFTLAAVLLLALGIGANTAIFSLLNAILIRPLPGIAEPECLVLLGRTVDGTGFDSQSYANYRDHRDQNSVLSGLTAYEHTAFNLSAAGDTERVTGAIVSGNYFDVLGVRASIGRTFLIDEDRVPGRDAVAVISQRLWQRRWANDPAVVGSNIRINDHPFTIVGVVSEGFAGTDMRQPMIEVWVPIAMHPQLAPGANSLVESRADTWLELIGRLKPGVGLAQARANLAAIARRLEESYPENRRIGIRVAPYHALGGADAKRDTTWLLSIFTVVTGVLLLVACANVANLLLARASVRCREMAIRLALGANRRRLFSQLLAEGLVLAFMGGASSLLVASWSEDLLVGFFPLKEGLPPALDLVLDSHVVAYALGLSVLSTLAFALAPALRATRTDVLPNLKAGEAATTPRRSRLRNGLVVLQVALCVVVLAGAALLTRTLHSLRSIDPLLRTENMLLVSLDPASNGYDEAAARQLYSNLLERVRALAGVESVTLGRLVPFSSRGMALGRVFGGSVVQGKGLYSECNLVGPDYFRTMGIRVLRGRDFRAADHEGARRVVVVNETLVRRLWPNEDPLDRALRLGGSGSEPWFVAGVAQDSKYRSAREPERPLFYLPVFQFSDVNMPMALLNLTVHVRSVVSPLSLLDPVKRAVRELDPHLPVYNARTMEAHLDNSFWPWRMAATLVGFFSLLTMTMAVLGLYAVVAYDASRRTREIGLRIALGATAATVVRPILRQGMVLSLAGLGSGILLAVAATRVLGRFLYGVTSTDPPTFAGVSLLMVIVTLLACYIPARRATRVDPIVALRHE